MQFHILSFIPSPTPQDEELQRGSIFLKTLFDPPVVKGELGKTDWKRRVDPIHGS